MYVCVRPKLSNSSSVSQPHNLHLCNVICHLHLCNIIFTCAISYHLHLCNIIFTCTSVTFTCAISSSPVQYHLHLYICHLHLCNVTFTCAMSSSPVHLSSSPVQCHPYTMQFVHTGVVLLKGQAACEIDTADELLTAELMFNGTLIGLDKHQLVSHVQPIGESCSTARSKDWTSTNW